MIKKQEYLNYIHLFRGFAILIIVGIHCRISLPWAEQSLSRQVFITLLDNGTVLFVFIAGFLFQYLKYKFEYISYLKRKAKFVIVPYILVSIPAIIADLQKPVPPIWLPDYLIDQSGWLQGFFMLISGKHLGPFWFIPMIVIFYIISPILVWLDRPVFYKTAFPLIFIGGLFTFRFGFFATTLDSFIHYLPIYIFGMWAGRYRHQLISMKLWILLTLVLIYIGIALLEIFHVVYVPKLSSFKEADLEPYFVFNFAKLKVSILCLILLRSFYWVKKEIEILDLLGDYSFGIYFVHLYVIVVIEELISLISPGFQLGAITFIIYTLIVTLCSIGIVHIIKKIFRKHSRWIIGS